MQLQCTLHLSKYYAMSVAEPVTPFWVQKPLYGARDGALHVVENWFHIYIIYNVKDTCYWVSSVVRNGGGQATEIHI